MSGFFLGGLSQGFQDQQQVNIQQQALGLRQKALQQEQQNFDTNKLMQLRKDAYEHMQVTIDHLKNGNPTWTDQQILSNGAVAPYINMLSDYDKRLGLDPNNARFAAAGMAAGKSQIEEQGALARAKEGPLGEQLKVSEINKNRAMAGQPPIDTSGKPANPQNPDLDTDTQLGGKQFKTTGDTRLDSVVKGVAKGDIPPDKAVGFKDRKLFNAGLEDNGVNLSKLMLQWKQAEKQVQSLNGPQMTRYVGLNTSVIGTIDRVNELARQMNLSGVPLLNKAQLQSLIQTEGNSPRGQLAIAYVTQVGILKEEFANLANGGYAPTEPAWALANEQVNGNYGVKELGSSLNEIRRALNIRINAIPGMQTLGPGSENQYTGNKGSGDWEVKEIK